jgi:hypothetical protein
MANTSVLEELKKFIPYAVQNSVRRKERQGSDQWMKEFDDQLINMYLSGVKKRKSDKALCEYAKLIANANGVELTDNIKYFIILLNI